MMAIERAIEILKPETIRYSPSEYEEALRLARVALRLMIGGKTGDREFKK